MFFVQTRRTDDAAELAERKRRTEREEGLLLTLGPNGDEGGARCGREKSFNVKVTWAHAHRIDRTQK